MSPSGRKSEHGLFKRYFWGKEVTGLGERHEEIRQKKKNPNKKTLMDTDNSMVITRGKGSGGRNRYKGHKW